MYYSKQKEHEALRRWKENRMAVLGVVVLVIYFSVLYLAFGEINLLNF